MRDTWFPIFIASTLIPSDVDLMSRYQLKSVVIAVIVAGAKMTGLRIDRDLARGSVQQAEGPGLEAIAEGFRHLGYKDDHALNAAEWIVYDALYAYAQEMVKRGKPAGQFVN